MHHLSLFILLPALAFGQTVEKSAIYTSEIDENLTIKKVSVLPVVDNVDGIYARPFESELVSIIQSDHKWDYVESTTVGPMATPQDLEANTTQVMALGKSIGADALLASKISRGPDGLTIRLSLFLSVDGKLLATEESAKIQNFDTKNVQAQARELLSILRSRIPYQGTVLSRTGTRVTVNLGRRDGVKKDQIITAIQIINATRHPKFNFLINTEKEILGKIKLRKVEDTLSFGDIVSEKERGAIRKQSKIAGVDSIEYPDLPSVGKDIVQGNTEDPASQLAFGQQPGEWRPINPASFGLVGLSLGLGNYNMNSTQAGTTYSASKPFYFNLRLRGELWFNPSWQVEADMRQGIMTVSNPNSSSTPSELNLSTATYSMHFGYNWLIRDDFWGPKVTLLAGFKQYSSTVDDASPRVFSTMVYSGLDLGLRGSLPIDVDRLWRAGATFNLLILPAVQQKPVSTNDAASNQVNVYSIFAARRIGQRMEAKGQLEFEYYSTSYGGSGTTNSQRITTVYGGIVYMF